MSISAIELENLEVTHIVCMEDTLNVELTVRQTRTESA